MSEGKKLPIELVQKGLNLKIITRIAMFFGLLSFIKTFFYIICQDLCCTFFFINNKDLCFASTLFDSGSC